MPDNPDAESLLLQARTDLLELLLPLLPADTHYEARMIANVLGIAARELTQGQDSYGAECAALASLYPGTGEAQLEPLRRRLAEEIRAGRWDAEPAAHQALRKMATAQLQISNPKALQRGEAT